MSRPLPRLVGVLVEALRFAEADSSGLDGLSEADWRALLALCDRARLTLLLVRFEKESWPAWVRDRLRSNLRANIHRRERLRRVHEEIATALEARGLPHVVLKGQAREDDYAADPRLRVQYDLDLYCPEEAAGRALEALGELGYEPVSGLDRLRTDHFPPLIRPKQWNWQGDYFDPEIPVAVEVHFRFWDREMERVAVPGVEEFWNRRRGVELDLADDFAYRCLHVLRHLFRGSLGLYPVYELAWFLQRRSEDSGFWADWLARHGPGLRRLEAIVAGLARRWFSCELPAALAKELAACPDEVRRWLERFAFAPLEAIERPNKSEIWLHLALVNSPADGARVLLRRLVPMRAPSLTEAVYVPPGRHRWTARATMAARYARYAATRLAHHGRTLLPAIAEGTGWWWETRGLGWPYLRFLGGSACYTLGLFVFFLLYNLHLLDRGFREDFLGLVAGAFTAGTLAGALPAGWLAAVAGLRPALLLCFGGTAAVSAARSLAGGEPALLALSFGGGLFSALWMVAMAPAVAGLTSKERRPLGYSIFFAVNIGLGIAGGLLGGRLSAWVSRLGAGDTSATQVALLAACALTAAALWPVRRLRFSGASSNSSKAYPRGPFIRRFLLVFAVWSLGTGSFNPFFNAFFSRHAGASVEQIGLVFSIGQAAQVGALLAAPFALRRLGLMRAIAGMQLMTAVSLAGLAASPVRALAAVYSAYMAFQWMSEPGIYSLLMNRVRPEERSGAAALHLLVTASAQTLASAAAGAAFSLYGYPKVLAGAAGVAAIAGLLFWALLKER